MSIHDTRVSGRYITHAHLEHHFFFFFTSHVGRCSQSRAIDQILDQTATVHHRTSKNLVARSKNCRYFNRSTHTSYIAGFECCMLEQNTTIVIMKWQLNFCSMISEPRDHRLWCMQRFQLRGSMRRTCTRLLFIVRPSSSAHKRFFTLPKPCKILSSSRRVHDACHCYC